MKNNISFYSHDIGSHNNWKFKTLRKKFGWAAEGRFWALNNMIAACENCMLDINDEIKMLSISADLDLNEEEFKVFIEFLITKCKLLIRQGNDITTERVQETLLQVTKKRAYQSEWKKGKSNIESGKSSIETTVSNIESEFSNIDFEQSKVDKSKVDKNISIGDESPKTNSLEIRRKKFYDLLVEKVNTKELTKETARAFYDYWTEPNKSCTKMRWELEKTWDLSLRIKRWHTNEPVKAEATKELNQSEKRFLDATKH